MIGAMPAVAVRHERRKQEKRGKRPSMLHLHGGGGGGLGGGLGSAGGGSGGGSGCGGGGGAQLKHPSPPSRGSSPAPSPLASPPSHHDDLAAAMPPEEFYVCGKVSVLHLVVVSLLLGAILLIVGLVQLKPGADASDHRYYLLAAGGLLMLLGLALTAVRCWVLPWRERRYEPRPTRVGSLQSRLRKDDSQAAALTAGPCTDASLDAVLVNDAADSATYTDGSMSDVPRVITCDSLPEDDATLGSPEDTRDMGGDGGGGGGGGGGGNSEATVNGPAVPAPARAAET